MPRGSMRYHTMEELAMGRDRIAWYWRVIALASSWMILGGYLILPSAFTHDAQLRFSKGVLSILIVTVMTTGYSCTALLCFACRNWMFQAESVFLPALTSSALGVLTILWCFASSRRYEWNNAAIVTTALACSSTVLYGFLLFLSYRKIKNLQRTAVRNTAWGDTGYLKNYLVNTYPSAYNGPETFPSDEELVNHQMALLLQRRDDLAPSPDAGQSTFRIDLPEDPTHEAGGREIFSAPPQNVRYAHARMPSPPHQQRSTWDRMTGKGRSGNQLSVDDSRGRSSRPSTNTSRAVSREDRERRRREIESGL